MDFLPQGFNDTHGVNSTFIEKNESKLAENEGDDEIDKEQFLVIVSNAFAKIIDALHPRVGDSLNQIRNMYAHFIEQVEANHHQELQSNALQIQELQAGLTELQVQKQQLALKMTQSKALTEDK